MNRQIFVLSVLSLSITACSGVGDHRKASGDFEYAKQIEPKQIVVPEGLQQPEQARDFFITNDINHKGPVGSKVDVRAPSLVLPIAASSRVEQNSNEAKIWFDQVLDDKDLQIFIYQAIEEQLAADGANLNLVDAKNKIFESDWVHNEVESGYWLFKSINVAESLKFNFVIETKPHGRSVALSVKVSDYKKADESGADQLIDPIDKQRAEMAMLNSVVSQVDYKYRLAQKENRLMRASQQLVSHAENTKGEASYLVDMDIDSLWSNMPIFFEDYGFDIADLDESKKIYYVNFVKPEANFWDSIWGEDAPSVDLTNARYQFNIESLDEKSLITIYDAKGEALSRDIMEKIYPVMSPALSFREIF